MEGKKRLDNKRSDDEGKERKPIWRKSDVELVKDRLRDVREYLDDRKIEVPEEERNDVLRAVAGKDNDIVNLLDMVPFRRKGVEKDGEFLRVPVYRSDAGEKIASRLKFKTRRGIRMDPYGWAVWEMSDGKKDIRCIGELLKERFGEEVEPLYPRLSKFYAYMVKLELMKISEGRAKDR